MKKEIELAVSGLTMVKGVLRKVTIENALILHDSDDIIYRTKEFGEVRNLRTYLTPQNFEEDCPNTTTCRTKANNDGFLEMYHLVEGVPTKELVDCDIFYEQHYSLTYLHPDGYYFSREDCFKNSSYTEILDDGTEVLHEGIGLKFKLEPEQQALVGELKALLAKVNDMGIALFYDTCDCQLRAANKKKFKCLGAEYYGDADSRLYTSTDNFELVSNDVYYDGEEDVWGDREA